MACFKRQKETPCSRPESTKEKTGTPCFKSGSFNDAMTTNFESESGNDAETPTVKQESSEERSNSSGEVREALRDEHFQKLISDIDSSPDAMNELDKAMGVVVFRIFSDKIYRRSTMTSYCYGEKKILCCKASI